MTTVQVEDKAVPEFETNKPEEVLPEDGPVDESQPTQEPYTPAEEVASTEVTSQTTGIVADKEQSFQENELLKKEQLKWFGALIRNMKKKKDAHLFLVPVDPVALNIPTYFTVITKPMDISTIEKKLVTAAYNSAQEAMDDVTLMFQNCYTFNGVDSAVSLMARNLHQWYTKETEKLPKSVQDIEMKKKKKPSSMLNIAAAREYNGDARPKRDSRDETGKRKLLSKKGITEMKFCNYVHREMTKKQYAQFVWPFLAPVDPIALGIPHYFDIIKEPMDLSTIRKKLDLSEYNAAEEFESDVRLMLQNCFTFNPVGSDVHNLGKQLETLFNTKWSEKASFMSQHSDLNRRTFDSSDDDGDDEDLQHIQMLKTQLQLLNQQLQTLMEKRNRRKKRRSMTATTPTTMSTPGGSTIKKPKSKSKNPDKKKKRSFPQSSDDERMPEHDITYEQKRELSDNINILPPDRLPQVFEIIKENTQLNAAEDEEIELDIDSLDKAVLWKLYLFVRKHTRPPKKAKYDDTDNAAAGPATYSSSESGSDDSDDYSDDNVVIMDEQKPVPIVTIKGPKKPIFKQSKPRAPKVSNPVQQPKKRSAPPSPPPFRTEKGEFTTYSNNFKVTAPATHKVAQPVVTKPKYDSVLDSAWDDHETLKKPDPIVNNVPKETPKSPKQTQKSKEQSSEGLIIENPTDFIQKKSPVQVQESDNECFRSDQENSDQEQERFDLQGQADIVNAFYEEMGEPDTELLEERERFLEETVETFSTIRSEDWILNIDRERYESDEDGEL